VSRYKTFEQDISITESDEILSLPIRDLFKSTGRNPFGTFPRFCKALAGR